MLIFTRILQAVLIAAGMITQYAYATIETSPAEVIKVNQTIVLDSQVEAINKTALAAQTTGQITEIYFDAGDIVAAGDVLLRLKDKNQKAAFQAAQAALKASKADLDDAENSLRRIEDLFARKLTSVQSLDDANARYNIAKATYDGAKAKLDSAYEQLNYTVVKAPYGGIVLERHVNLGEIVAPGTPLFTGTSLSHLRVVTQIPQKDIEQIRQYAEVVIDLPQGKKFTQQKEALKFYAYASPQSSTFKVRTSLPSDVKGLYPGMYLKSHFTIGKRDALVVPSSAIVARSELRAIYVQDKQGKIHLRQIRVGEVLDNGMTEVLAGLSRSENIVINPLTAIKVLTANTANSIDEVK
jgi:RND family efflux transporter MFP subunit